MKLKYPVLIIIALSLLVLSLNSCSEEALGGMQSDIPERHDLLCILVDDVWKIVDADDVTRTEITVARGDTVVWTAPENRDIYFQFMDEEITGTFTAELLQGESLTVVIGNDANTGDHPYAVFVHEARVFAQGESPPRMIIR
jgi:hypothetical protein